MSLRRLTTVLAASALLLVAPTPVAAQDEAVTPASEIAKGRWKNDRKIPEGYDRIYIGHYEVQFNTDEELAREVGSHLDQMFDVFKKLSPPKKTLGGKLCVKVFRSHEDFRDYGAPPGAAAYFSPTDDEMVGYDTGVVGGKLRKEATGTAWERWAQLEEMDLLGIYSHEGWHQYFHWTCGSKIDFPAWCDEGIAEYFYSSWFNDDDKVVVGAPNDVRLPVIQGALERGKYVPFETFVAYTQAPYYRDPSHNYAQGWAMTHFFMHHPDYAGEEFVRKFVKIFIDKHSIEETVPRVFRRVDWKKMEEDWKAWVMAIPQRVNPSSPMAAETRAFNVKADARRAALPPKVREALEESIAKRAPAPWGDDPGPTPAAGKTIEIEIDGETVEVEVDLEG